MKSLAFLAGAAGCMLVACVRPAPSTTAASPTTVAGGGTSAANARDSVSHDEVTRQAVGVFGDSVAPELEEALVEGGGAEPAGPSWDIDVRSYETHARVEHYVEVFTGPARERVEDRLERATRYEGMIRLRMRAAGLPEDLLYLAFIESGFNPHAYSRSAAVGMWQFMYATARGVGMRVDWWVDERRDPIASTEGAVKFLGMLNEQFGSLYLAAAAYNGGPGRVSRGLSRYADDFEGTTGDDLFFALAEKDYLRRETEEYVPQLIAAALVGKEPARYGLVVAAQPLFVYDSVMVGPATPLAAVALASGSTVDAVRDLNPHLLRGMTPPSDSFFVRVPPGRTAGFDSAWRALAPDEQAAFTTVTSRKGQTLSTLAAKHDVTAEQLGWYNPNVRRYRPGGKLIPGQDIRVPAPAVVAAARNVPDPTVERYSSSRRMHVVKRGETLGHIAIRYKTTVKEIMRLNRMKKTLIIPGQSLAVSGAPIPVRSRGSR
ncbi:MAG: transglycosylase SLT domain-containing protein [Gemmatimonadaceae bacterium]